MSAEKEKGQQIAHGKRIYNNGMFVTRYIINWVALSYNQKKKVDFINTTHQLSFTNKITSRKTGLKITSSRGADRKVLITGNKTKCLPVA